MDSSPSTSIFMPLVTDEEHFQEDQTPPESTKQKQSRKLYDNSRHYHALRIKRGSVRSQSVVSMPTNSAMSAATLQSEVFQPTAGPSCTAILLQSSQITAGSSSSATPLQAGKPNAEPTSAVSPAQAGQLKAGPNESHDVHFSTEDMPTAFQRMRRKPAFDEAEEHSELPPSMIMRPSNRNGGVRNISSTSQDARGHISAADIPSGKENFRSRKRKLEISSSDSEPEPDFIKAMNCKTHAKKRKVSGTRGVALPLNDSEDESDSNLEEKYAELAKKNKKFVVGRYEDSQNESVLRKANKEMARGFVRD